MSNEATDGLAPSVFDHTLGAIRADSCVFLPMSEEGLMRVTTGSDSRRAPEARCSCNGISQAQLPRPGVPDGNIAGPKFQHGF